MDSCALQVRNSYVPALRPRLLRPLAERGTDGVEEVLESLDAYGITKDDFDTIFELELLVGGAAKPALAQIPTAAKSALTRKYNQSHQQFEKKKGGGAGGAGGLMRFTDDGVEDEAVEDEGGDAEEGGEEGDEDEDVKPVAAKKGAASAASAKGKGKAKAK